MILPYAPPASQSEQGADQKVRIMVLNGTSRPDLDVIAADQLRWHGLEVTGTGSAQERDHPQNQIIVYQDRPQALEALVALLHVEPTNIIREPPPSQGSTEVQVDILIILGEDYDPCR
jgi:hypothetical protein